VPFLTKERHLLQHSALLRVGLLTMNENKHELSTNLTIDSTIFYIWIWTLCHSAS